MALELPRQLSEVLVKTALMEDIGMGDVTAEAVPPGKRMTVSLVAKSEGILAGVPLFQLAFRLEGAEAAYDIDAADGDAFEPGQTVLRFTTLAAAALRAERTALNFLGHLSGIATLTREYARRLPAGTHIAATRKTTPGLRALEKYAVRVGGGLSHRNRLDDMVLFKENHLRAIGGIAEAVARARRGLSHHLNIQVEVTNLQEIDEALLAGADLLLLDNFSPGDLPTALERIGGRVPVEVSGNIRLENLTQYAVAGVDTISVGELTGGASRRDFSLQFHV